MIMMSKQENGSDMGTFIQKITKTEVFRYV